MEILHENHIHEIDEALNLTGRPTGVMLQVGTRNTQNFELLKAIGRQNEYPVLLKRGFGITLNESLKCRRISCKRRKLQSYFLFKRNENFFLRAAQKYG